MSPEPYNLFWCSILPGGSGARMLDVVPRRRPGLVGLVAPLGVELRLVEPPPIEAIILYPAFLTPTLVEEGGDLELLLLAPGKAPEGMEGSGGEWFTPEIVNRHLKVAPGLDSGRWARQTPLTPDARRDIAVKRVSEKLEPEVLSTHQGFQGIIDERFFDNLAEWQKERGKVKETAGRRALDAVFRVKLPAACLAAAVGPSAEEVRKARAETGLPPPGVWQAADVHDELVRSVLLRKNGPGLGGRSGKGKPASDGRGLHCFPVRAGRAVEKLDLAAADLGEPVRAHHPVFVYPKGALQTLSVGHVSDLHVNARQNLLARSPARVIDLGDTDVAPEASRDRPPVPRPGTPSTPPVGDLVTVYSDNVLEVMEGMAAEGADLLLVGGDLIDHTRNAYPFTGDHAGEDLRKPKASKVWELVDLDDKGRVATNYQLFADQLSFYSMARHFCATHGRPVFVVSGNHDGYEQPYGISPRMLLAGRLNEGIPADHNLTFYEAILAFGKSFGTTPSSRALWLYAHLFEWFYGVFTPFRDFAVDLPHHRLVGVGWGDDEGKFGAQPSTAHGMGHLPRATETFDALQKKLVEDALAKKDRRAVLFSHFTCVSYDEAIPDGAGASAVPGRIAQEDDYGLHDMGTFEKERAWYYDALTGENRPLCVFTGHSHRKGLYFLTRDATTVEQRTIRKDKVRRGRATAMWSLREPLLATSPALRASGGGAAIVVSDSAGPLPRQNDHGEFGKWGSDRPAGTLVQLWDQGVLAVKPIRAGSQRAKPRLAVAVDYLHVMEGRILDKIFTAPHDPGLAKQPPNRLEITLRPAFPTASIQLASVVLYGKLAKTAPWTVIPLSSPGTAQDQKSMPLRVGVPAGSANDFEGWLRMGKAPRLASFVFRPKDSLVRDRYEWTAGGAWTFEMEVKLVPVNALVWRFELVPRVEIPDFALLERFFPEAYGP